MPIPVNLTPPPVRTRGLLLDAANLIPDGSFLAARGADRWPAEGVTWNPSMFVLPDADEAQCDSIYDKQPDDILPPVTQPAFLLWRSLQCSRLSGALDLLTERINYSLDDLASASFAAELETGAASGGLGLVGSAQNEPTVVSGTAVVLPVAFAALENYLADTLHGAVGFIHLTTDLLLLAASLGLVEWDGSVFRSRTGHVVVGDSGHSGAGTPAGDGVATAGEGEAWIYATSTVWYAETSIQDSGSFGVDPGGFDFSTNVDKPVAERYGLVLFDPDVLGAALVDVTASAESVHIGGS